VYLKLHRNIYYKHVVSVYFNKSGEEPLSLKYPQLVSHNKIFVIMISHYYGVELSLVVKNEKLAISSRDDFVVSSLAKSPHLDKK